LVRKEISCKTEKKMDITTRNLKGTYHPYFPRRLQSTQVSGSLVTTSWPVLGLPMEEVSTYSGYLPIYWINRSG
jgi:hypothetical protein